MTAKFESNKGTSNQHPCLENRFKTQFPIGFEETFPRYSSKKSPLFFAEMSSTVGKKIAHGSSELQRNFPTIDLAPKSKMMKIGEISFFTHDGSIVERKIPTYTYYNIYISLRSPKDLPYIPQFLFTGSKKTSTNKTHPFYALTPSSANIPQG